MKWLEVFRLSIYATSIVGLVLVTLSLLYFTAVPVPPPCLLRLPPDTIARILRSVDRQPFDQDPIVRISGRWETGNLGPLVELPQQ